MCLTFVRRLLLSGECGNLRRELARYCNHEQNEPHHRHAAQPARCYQQQAQIKRFSHSYGEFRISRSRCGARQCKQVVLVNLFRTYFACRVQSFTIDHAKGLWQPWQSFILAGFSFLCHAQILADVSNPSTERDRLRPSTPCATVFIIQQLLPTHMQHHELKPDSNKASLTVEGHRLDNLPVPSVPWRPCTNLCFF